MSAHNLPRVPTLRAVDHVADTVPNLDEAIRFVVDDIDAGHEFGQRWLYLQTPGGMQLELTSCG